MAFFQRIKALHRETGNTLEIDAELAGVPEATFRHLLYAQGHNPSHSTILKLAQHYDVSTDYLLGVSDIRRRFGE